MLDHEKNSIVHLCFTTPEFPLAHIFINQKLRNDNLGIKNVRKWAPTRLIFTA